MNNIIHNDSLMNKNKNNLMNKSEKIIAHKSIKDKSSSSYDLMKANKYKKLNINKLYNNKRNNIAGPDKLNNIFRSKDFALGRSIKMDFGSFSYEEKDKMLTLENKNNTDEKVIEGIGEKEDDINNINNTESKNVLPRISNISNIPNNNFNYQDNDTAETVTNMNRNKTEIMAIDEKSEHDELSFISREDEKDNNNNNNNKITNIKTFKNVKKFCDHERLLLEGIENEPPREEIVLNQKRNVVLKDNGQLYRENLALLQLTNPKKFESIRKKDEYDMKLLIKKLGKSREKKHIQLTKKE